MNICEDVDFGETDSSSPIVEEAPAGDVAMDHDDDDDFFSGVMDLTKIAKEVEASGGGQKGEVKKHKRGGKQKQAWFERNQRARQNGEAMEESFLAQRARLLKESGGRELISYDDLIEDDLPARTTSSGPYGKGQSRGRENEGYGPQRRQRGGHERAAKFDPAWEADQEESSSLGFGYKATKTAVEDVNLWDNRRGCWTKPSSDNNEEEGRGRGRRSRNLLSWGDEARARSRSRSRSGRRGTPRKGSLEDLIQQDERKKRDERLSRFGLDRPSRDKDFQMEVTEEEKQKRLDRAARFA